MLFVTFLTSYSFQSLVHAFIYPLSSHFDAADTETRPAAGSQILTPCSCGAPRHLLRWINMYAHKKAPGIMCTLTTDVDWARGIIVAACRCEGGA
ncbi:hypothetical protein B0H16DRAFT_1737815 [Mycena metata]|uniref:Secreted protein n=1 Tax=Mycena metata TaxID=1033252 RepID=A0AAD7HK22_9AGAR|nr:hypothetical protein B0H16DRAFT_1737815 [Mycena metata]